MEKGDVRTALHEALPSAWRTWPLPSSSGNLLYSLGGVLHYTGEVRAEVRRRVAIAHQAFGKHRKLVYQCETFPLHKRAEIFRSLIMSRLLYGADSWALWMLNRR